MLGSKQLELLHELVPKASTIGLLINPNYQGSELEAVAVQAAARAIGRKILVLNASNEGAPPAKSAGRGAFCASIGGGPM